MDVLDALTAQAHTLLTSDNRNAGRSGSVRLARSVHATPPATPADVRSQLRDTPHVLPALARHAQAGDRYALLIAAVLLRDLLRTIAQRAAGHHGDDIAERTDDALALTFTLLRAATEPDTLTEPVIAAQLSKQLQRHHSGPDDAVLVDPHAQVLDRPSGDLDQDRDNRPAATRRRPRSPRHHHARIPDPGRALPPTPRHPARHHKHRRTPRPARHPKARHPLPPSTHRSLTAAFLLTVSNLRATHRSK